MWYRKDAQAGKESNACEEQKRARYDEAYKCSNLSYKTSQKARWTRDDNNASCGWSWKKNKDKETYMNRVEIFFYDDSKQRLLKQ